MFPDKIIIYLYKEIFEVIDTDKHAHFSVYYDYSDL